ncbi:Protein of unknown function [Microbacterium sp. ru370.1]|uniref:excalibur calcium-binding domain-containing protein n=1 Tax=unclassified Microbacterium TaxID=2609290 RepID=UPI000889FBCC|nr:MULTISPECIES: DUF1524 domain-containing protein [unclassified Microbacterium]SDO31855.1 Protein of unknown function [Microbacterium sp. ru370.1]SIT76562.1 Protein of unknown function [Microbacterium sp. RU1D]
MTNVTPGWYPDTEIPGRLRWWDGRQWTNDVAPLPPAPTVTTPPPPATRREARSRLSRVPTWGWIVAGLVLLVALWLLAPFVAMVALVVLITGIVALARNAPTWLRFRSRSSAAIWTVVAVVAFAIAGSITTVTSPAKTTPVAQPAPVATASATPSPTATPTASATPFADDQAALAAFAGQAGTVADASVTTDKIALAALDTLAVKGRAPKTGYDRDEFGQRWLDVDRNGCDTRNDMLGRDLTDAVRAGTCRVTAGTLTDPYTGASIAFVRGQGTSELVQIDHVVSLSDAWQKGAQQLTTDQRASFANDPLNLLAVDGSANAQKGDGDAATWLPAQKSFRCTYVATQIAVKATYGLWVTEAERDAMKRVLEACPDQSLPTSSFAAPAPAPAPVVEPEPVVAPEPVVVEPAPAPAEPAPAPVVEAPAPAPDVYYANCTEVRAAGAAPIYAGQPGYSRKLDRDGDGIACE